MNTQESQSGVIPIFYMGSKQSKRLTEEYGRPQFIDVEMVEIRIPGDSRTVVHKKVTEEEKHRWPRHYEAFKKGQEAPVDGLPLKHCPLFTSAQVKTLNAQNIFTVESLANLPDGFIERIGMGARALVAKAKAYVKDSEGTAETTKLAAENEKLRADIEMLKRQIAELGKPEESSINVNGDIVAPKVEKSAKEMPKTFEEAGFSSRTKTALRKNGVETIEDLQNFTLDDISNIPGIGIGAVDEISRLFE